MRVIHHAADLGPGNGQPSVAVGMFDGVHLGHQRVLRHALQEAASHHARAIAITFDQHPSAVVAPGREPRLIYSLSQRLRVIESMGVDVVWLIHFDRAFSEQTGEQFVRAMVRDFGGIRSISIGENFTFGYKRSGNVPLLKRLGGELEFEVHALSAEEWRGEAISSTRIRDSVQAGDLAAASAMLGRQYSLRGPVLRGDQLGRKLGFPTANLDSAGLVLPPNGVYAGWARLEGQTWPAVMNIGLRPTLNQPEPAMRVEVHLLDFAGDLYGKELEFELVKAVRNEQKFASLDALKEQIGQDISQARQYLARRTHLPPNG